MQTRPIGTFIVMMTLMLLLSSTSLAQSPTPAAGQGSQSSGGPARSNGPASPNTADEQGQPNSGAATETTPLVGAKEFGPGSTGPAQSYFIPSFQYSGLADTNPGNKSSGEKRLLESTYIGNLTLQRVTRGTQFNLSYAGGAQFYNQFLTPTASSSLISNGTFHQVSVGESITRRRWELFLGDEGSYLPESPEGFTGFGGLQSFNTGLGGALLSSGGNLNGLLQPDQSILSGRVRRLSNSSVGQLQYDMSPRTTLAVTGAYGALNFVDPGFVDDDYVSLLASFTHAFGPRNYVGVTYLHSLIHFHSPHQDILNRGLLFSYGHKILGKLSFEASAGSLLNQFAKPTGGSTSRGFWTTYTTLRYRWQRTDFSASFRRNITGGSGVLRGAETDLVEAHIGRQFFRTTYFGLNFGHAYNQSLAQATTVTRRAKAETWEGGINLSRELGSHLSFYIQYNVQRQIANASLCVANRCGVTFFRQVGGIGLNWHTRPIRLH